MAVQEVDYRDGLVITPVWIRRYADNQGRADSMNLLIISPSGTQKIYLTSASGISTCQSEHPAARLRMDDAD